MPRPVHFEIPSSDPEKAMAFYGAVFGWTFNKWGSDAMPYWLVNTGPSEEPGINGGILPKHDPKQPCVNTISVANVDESVAKAVEHGATVALPKMAVPGVGWLAYCNDLDGHCFGMMQMDATAK